jgi:RNA polymerase sigma-70 factor, ECF subfamily
MGARQDEFERMAMPHVPSLLRVARRLSRDQAAAEDLVQETMLLAWRGRHQFREGTNARAWLFRILFHQFYSQGRKLRTEPQTVPPSALARETAAGFRARSSMLEAVEMNEALAALTPEHRAVLLLAVVEGFTCEEIAGIVSAPIGTVMSRLSRARQALRERLSGTPCAKGGAL